MNRKFKVTIIILIVVLVLFSRFAFLDLRVLHHDEGVNYFFAEKILRGDGFQYDPGNYHGPLYFYLIFASFFVFGIGEFALRFPAAAFGMGIALFPLIFRIGRKRERIVTSVFLLLSPSLMYYSRYSIHEIVFAFFSLVCVYSLSLIIERRELTKLPVFALALAGIFVLKETAIIMLFVLFVIIVVNWKNVSGIRFKNSYREIGLSIFLFVGAYVLFFTSFFTNLGGLGDSFRAFTPWIDRGLHEVGHDKPFYYYLGLMLQYEWPILLFALISIWGFRRFKDRIFYINLVIWFALIFLIYSFISYKTPWLVVNMVVPMCFLAGMGFERIRGRWKWILFGIGILYLACFSVYVNFVNTGGEDNRFAYVHTDREILNMAGKIDSIYGMGDKILIVSSENEYWPLPFYLRGKEILYLPEEDLEGYSEVGDYGIVILRDRMFKEGDWQGYEHENYRLREGVNFVVVWRE